MKTIQRLGSAAAVIVALVTTTVAAVGAPKDPASLNKPVPGAKPAAAAPDGSLGMAILSASINADGTILRGEGVTTSGTSKLSAGLYQVGFLRDITECVYNVSVGEGGIGGATPAAIGVTRRSGNANGVFVQVKNPPDEVSEDRAFFVLVFCAR